MIRWSHVTRITGTVMRHAEDGLFENGKNTVYRSVGVR